MKKLIQFIKEAAAELKKVSWPSQEEVMGSTWVVIIMVILVAVILWLMDMGASELIQMLLKSIIGA